MSYNPISMDDEGVMSFAGGSWQQNGVDANVNVEEQRATASVGGVSIIEPTMAPREFIRRCQQQYYFEFSWQVPFPQVPAAPLLYLPEALKELLHDSAPLGVMQAELDAMSEGVLERIPLAYYLLRPEVVEETCRIAKECEQRVGEMQQQAAVAGLPEILTWKPEDVNPYLEKADAELLDTDIDLNLFLERDKPSLSLLQRPLYTDMGLVPQEQRHLDRLARIFPEALRSQTLFSSSQGLEAKGETINLSEGLVAPLLHPTKGLRQTGLGNGQAETGNPQQWADGVRKSFRYARTIDNHFEKLLEVVARAKLGLDCNDPAAMRLTRKLWHQLFEDTRKEQQRSLWHQLCHFSYNYDGRSEAVEELERVLTVLELPQLQSWLRIVREYVDLLKKYISTLPGAAESRKEQLKISVKELDSLQQGNVFEPDLQPGPALRRVGKDLGANRQPVPIFPVEVMPLYPAGFDKAAAGTMVGDQEWVKQLGELTTALHHVLLPGAVVSDESKMGGPHVLVNNTELLVADKKSPKQLGDGFSVSYHASRENTFESLVVDENNTSSYLFQLCSVQEDTVPVGLANANGRHIVYNRLGIRNLFVKAPNAEAPPFGRYVLMYNADGERKRPRETYNDMEERYAPMQRVK